MSDYHWLSKILRLGLLAGAVACGDASSEGATTDTGTTDDSFAVGDVGPGDALQGDDTGGDAADGGPEDVSLDAVEDATSDTGADAGEDVSPDAAEDVAVCSAGAAGCACYANNTCNSGLDCLSGICGDCGDGLVGCACGAEAPCGDGATCNAGICVPCSDGALGCACADGACAAGLSCSTQGLCVACVAGALGCPCADGTCGSGLACSAQDVCVACTPGSLGCGCSAGSCDDGLKCSDGLCESACEAGTLGCACASGACTTGECVDGACVLCPRGTEGCPCYASGVCALGAVCGGAGLCEACAPGDSFCECNAVGLCSASGASCAGDGWCTAAGCDAEAPGASRCECASTGSCAEGNACVEGLCLPCSNDMVGCPCADGLCAGGLVCGGDGCAEPTPCSEACAAHEVCEPTWGAEPVCTGTCEEGWSWDEASGACLSTTSLTCVDLDCGATLNACLPGAAGADATCSGCLPGAVPNDPSDPTAACHGAVACSALPCAAAHFVCVEGGTVDGVATDAACTAGCQPFYLSASGLPFDEGGECLPVVTCAALGCEALHRSCTAETATANASCGACAFDYPEDPQSGECVAAPASCEPGVPGSLADVCAGDNRQCLPTAIGAICGPCIDGYQPNPAADGACQQVTTCTALGCNALLRGCVGELPFETCGDCFEGTVDNPADPGGACIPPPTCAQVTCAAGQYCLEATATTGATCFTPQCDTSKDLIFGDFSKKCVLCNRNCGDDAGETGRPWPRSRKGSDDCVCETDPGYYWDQGAKRAAPCDADGDGWVRDSAQLYLASADEAWHENARCDVHTIDRFVLENEHGQRAEVLICQGAQDFVRADLGVCAVPSTVSLYESELLDDQAEIDAAPTGTPAYAASGVGRRLRTSEVNGLTRACVAGADYNGNGRSDVSEFHGMSTDGLTAAQAVFANFSYFVELHDGYYEAGANAGRYVIRERSRCELDFPLAYGSTSDYWRQCTRNRDAAYDGTDSPAVGPDFGMDFARWSCAAGKGSCATPPPPTDTLPSPGVIPAHGLCEVAQLPHYDDECTASSTAPWECIDGSVWRGMSHHSQFRCVVVDDTPSLSQPHLPTSAFAPAVGTATFNRCHIACPAGDASCAADCQGESCVVSSAEPGTADPSRPVVTCEPVAAPAAGSVGFALTRYQGPGAYQRGCISEWEPNAVGVTGGSLPNGNDTPDIAPWRALCEGFTAGGAVGQGDPNAFGKLTCGCGTNFGGPGCNVGCGDADLLTSEGYATMPRSGLWMCAAPAASACVVSTCAPLDITDFSAPAEPVTLLGGAISVSGTELAIAANGSATLQNPHPVDQPITVGVDVRFDVNPNLPGTFSVVFDKASPPGVSGTPWTSYGLVVTLWRSDTRVTVYQNGKQLAEDDLGPGTWEEAGTQHLEVTLEGGALTLRLNGRAAFGGPVAAAIPGLTGTEGYVSVASTSGSLTPTVHVSRLSLACQSACQTPEQTATSPGGAVWTHTGEVPAVGITGPTLTEQPGAAESGWTLR